MKTLALTLKMSTSFAVAVTAIVAVATASFTPSISSASIEGARHRGLDCRSGEICALVCNVKGNAEYSLYEFAHYNHIDGFYTRVVQPDTSVSQEAQLQGAADRLGKVDPDLQTEYMKDIAKLKLGSTYVWGTMRKGVPTPEEKLKKLVAADSDKSACVSSKLAGFNQSLGAFQVNEAIYNHLMATDRAGLKSRMALVMVARSKSVGPEHLVDLERLNRRLFYTERDDKIAAQNQHEVPSTQAQLQDGIRRRVSLIFTAPVMGVNQLGDVKQTAFRITPASRGTRVAGNGATATIPAINVAMNNTAPNPATIIPGSDVGVPTGSQVQTQMPPATPSLADVQNGYNVPQLAGLPPEMAPVPNMNFAAATNGQPEVVPQGFGENPAAIAAMAQPEVDPNTNTSAQGLPEAPASR